jgi:hypothetical protein
VSGKTGRRANDRFDFGLAADGRSSLLSQTSASINIIAAPGMLSFG